MLKKAFTALTVLATVVYTVGLAAFVPTASAATSGSLIKASGAAVYYMGGDGKRYVFPDQKTYLTWYSDFSSVITISDAELASIQIGGNVTARPGVKLVKITTDPKVYAVGANGSLHWITTEAIAVALYGANWASMVNDVPDAFFVNYTVGSEITDASQYSPSAETAAATSINVDKGIGTDTTGPVLSTGSVTVSLAADTAAGQTVPVGASVEVAKFNFKAGSTKAQISTITLTAGGLGNATNIDDATLYVDGVKVGSSKSFNSDRIATFTFATPLEIPANAVKSVAVRVTFYNVIPANAEGFYSVGIAKAADITAGGSVMGSFPVNGNTMQATSTASIAEVSLTNNAATESAQFGQDDVLLADLTLSPSQEDVLFTSAIFENGGTNNADLLNNVKLLIDGDEVATGSINGKVITFTLNNFLMEKNQTYVIEVRGDIGVGNDGDTIKLFVRNRADFSFIGQTYGYGAQLVSGDWDTFKTAASAHQVTVSAGDITIDFDKSATPSKEVKSNTQNVVLATLSFVSKAENATINDIVDGAGDFRITGTNIDADDLENVELFDLSTNGVFSVAATFDTDRFELDLEDEDITLTKGIKRTFQVRADITDDAEDGDKFQVVLDAAAMTVTGDVSNADITDITPSNISSAVTTVKAASLEIATVPLTNTTIVPGAQDVQIYSALLKAGDADSVKISSVKLSADEDAAGVFADTNISQLELYLNGVWLKTLSNQIDETNDTITFNSLSTVNNANVIAAGQQVELKVVARFSSSFAQTGQFVTGIAVDADIVARASVGNDLVTVTGTIPATLDQSNGVNATGESRLVILASKGTLDVEMKVTNAKANRDVYIVAGQSTAAGQYLAELVFTTANEPVKVTDLRLENGAAVRATAASANAGDLTPTADKLGSAYNGYAITINAGGLDGTGVVVTASTAAGITLTVETDGGGAADPTWSDVVDAIEANATAAGIIDVVSTNGGDTVVVADAQTITLAGGADGNFTGSDLMSINLYNGSGTLVASTTPEANGDAKFTNVNWVFDADQATSLWLGVTTKGINVANVGSSTATEEAVISFDIYSVDAEGVNTAEELTVTPTGVTSKEATILAANVTAIENALSNGVLTGGNDKVIGKFTINADRGANRKADNTNVEATLESLILTVSADLGTSLSDVKAYVDGSPANTAADTTACAADGDVCTFDATELANLVNSGNFTGSITLVVTADVTTGADAYLQLSIDSLATDFEFGTTNGATGIAPLLPYITVSGGTLSN